MKIYTQSALFPPRISIHPPSQCRRVESIAVVVQTRLFVPGFGTESERIGVRLVAGLGEKIAEGVVVVLGNDIAVGVHQTRHVAVGVVEGELRTAAPNMAEEPADAAGALDGSGEIEAPEVGIGGQVFV